MNRRCVILDNLQSFNYNYGTGEYVTESGVKRVTNTEHLGSTLIKAMLSEVSEFCDPRIKDTWSLRGHQQVSS